FREDLFYRLNVMPIFLPPLRERVDDIPELVESFIKKFDRQHKRSIKTISNQALEILKNYPWPGNIRELENVIEHAFVIENTETIQSTSLPQHIRDRSQAMVKVDYNKEYSAPMDFELFKEKMEKEFIESALRANNDKINQTVAHANIPKNTLLRKIKKYGINVKDFAD